MHSGTELSVLAYVSSLPASAIPYLERVLDCDSVQQEASREEEAGEDLNEIADHMLYWSKEISLHMGLSAVMHAAEGMYPNEPLLQR